MAPLASSHSPASTSTATHGDSGPIQAIIVRCDVEKIRYPPWSATTIPADHPVFSRAVPPVPGLIKVPLVLHRVGTRSTNRGDLDNQIATYLNIYPDSRVAPPAWQLHVGTIVVVHHLEGVWMYCDHILDVFGGGEGAPRWLYNRQAFEEWWVGYSEEQKEFRPGKDREEDPGD
ncbi:hypothetical protein ACKRZS_005788 [Fusarium odoratissimum]